jgi:hypothetical protein
MARGKKKGGYQQPRNPAPVSGPGALARRTDGGPGQPVRVAPDEDRAYGERKALVEQQQAAPMAVDPRLEQTLSRGVFSPTERPQEPATAGAPFGPGPHPSAESPIPDDDDALLRAMYEVYPHPDILRMLMSRG